MSAKFTVLDDEGEPQELPSIFVACPRCRGNGVHDHPAFANGIGQDQFDEDPDFGEEYFAGRYDVACSECKGNRVIAEPELAKLTDEQKGWLDNFYRSMAEDRAERRMRERGIEF